MEADLNHQKKPSGLVELYTGPDHNALCKHCGGRFAELTVTVCPARLALHLGITPVRGPAAGSGPRDRKPPFQARSLVRFETGSERRVYQAGTEVTVIEGLPKDAAEPEVYIVEIAIEDKSLVGERRFDTAELNAVELERVQ